MSEEAIHAIRQKYTEYTFLYNNEALEDIGNTAEAVQISKLCGAMIEFKIPDEEDIADNVAVLGIVIAPAVIVPLVFTLVTDVLPSCTVLSPAPVAL